MLGVVCFQYLRCAADNNNIIFLFPYQHFLWLLPMFFYGRLCIDRKGTPTGVKTSGGGEVGEGEGAS